MKIKLRKEQIELFDILGIIVNTASGKIYKHLPHWFRETNEEDVLDILTSKNPPNELTSIIKNYTQTDKHNTPHKPQKQLYITTIETYNSGTYNTNTIFATKNKTKALKWEKQFNSIIKNNKERLTNNYNKHNNKQYFLQDYIVEYNPIAKITTIEYRK